MVRSRLLAGERLITEVRHVVDLDLAIGQHGRSGHQCTLVDGDVFLELGVDDGNTGAHRESVVHPVGHGEPPMAASETLLAP